MPTVALDATPLLGARTGIGTAVDGMFRFLAACPDLDVVGYGFTLRGWRQVADARPEGVRAVARPAPAGALLRAWGAVDWPPGEWWSGPADVVHGTNFVVPPTRRAARVVSVWDLSAVRYPELASAHSRRYPALVARAIAGGAWVHTGARSVAAEIVEHFGAAPERVRVVAPAVAVPVTPLTTYSGPPYVLGLGRTEPRKDFPALVRAFDRVAGTVPDLELRLAGPPGWAENDLAAAIAASPYAGRIRREGWVDDAATLMAGAAVFAYPSLYEGFGLPPLEAMARGVPVVATAGGAVPEVVGDAAELVEPGDADGLAAALLTVLTDGSRRADLIAAGRARVEMFSGPALADGLAQLYRDVLA
ncbi:MAG TPA: glycosyltransferase family 1 protein [Acidimicrobiales bacterium]|jgi:glycosyltransferase involved in cell wall biosynthesis|nr:glycosyltransferase family 1 protein [Acidimicrobiales bacterium]